MKYANRILLSDIDGTLLDSRGKLSKRNRAAIEYFIAEGGRFGIATGRGVKNAAVALPDIPVNFHSIFLNGSLLYHPETEEVVQTVLLDQARILPVVQTSLSIEPTISMQVYTPLDGYFVSEERHTDKVFVKEHAPYGFAELDAVTGYNWTKVLFNGTPEQLKWVEGHVAPLKAQGLVDSVYSCPYYYEVLPAGSNKGTMVKHIQRTKGKDDIVYAVGNYYNDAEMIQAADVGFFTENAPDDLKAISDGVCPSCDQDAIADVIYHRIACVE